MNRSTKSQKLSAYGKPAADQTVCDFDVPFFMNLFPKLLNVVRKTGLFQTCKVLLFLMFETIATERDDQFPGDTNPRRGPGRP
jgi:hypothetical protein